MTLEPALGRLRAERARSTIICTDIAPPDLDWLPPPPDPRVTVRGDVPLVVCANTSARRRSRPTRGFAWLSAGAHRASASRSSAGAVVDMTRPAEPTPRARLTDSPTSRRCCATWRHAADQGRARTYIAEALRQALGQASACTTRTAGRDGRTTSERCRRGARMPSDVAAADGSGLSRYDQTSPSTRSIAVLARMPRAGASRTVVCAPPDRGRRRHARAAHEGDARPKAASRQDRHVANVRALSGYVTTDRRRAARVRDRREQLRTGGDLDAAVDAGRRLAGSFSRREWSSKRDPAVARSPSDE